MTSRKPLQSMHGNKTELISDASIKYSYGSTDTLRRFQFTSQRTDTSNTPIKTRSIQQSITRTSRLNRPKSAKPTSKEVISTKSWQKEIKAQQEQQKQQKQFAPKELQEYLEQQEQQELYFYSSKETQTQQYECLPLNLLPLIDNDTWQSDLQQQTGENIEYEQEQPEQLTVISRVETNRDQSLTSLKRRYPDADQQTPLSSNDQHDLRSHNIPLDLSFPSATWSPSPPPPKRHHGLHLLADPDPEIPEDVQPLILPFDHNATSTESSISSPLEHENHTESHLQTPPDTGNQPHQSLLSKFQVYSLSSSSTSTPSSNHTQEELQQQQPSDGNDATSHPPPASHIDDIGASQLAVMKSKKELRTRSRANRCESLSQDSSPSKPKVKPSSPPTSGQFLHLPLSPVYNLNNDCLTEILKWCATTETLHEASLVCKHWRNVALQPYVWRTIDYIWRDIVQQLKPLSPCRGERWNRSDTTNNCNNDPLLSSPLVHIRSIYLNNILNSTRRLPETPTSSIFTNLCTLQLSTMHFKDILDLIGWTKHLKELECKNIQTVDSNDMVMITPFSQLQKLQLLKLHFASMCELIGPTSLSSIPGDNSRRQMTNNRWQLSPSLQILQITNTYDIEEFLTSSNLEPEVSSINTQQQQLTHMTTERMEKLVRSWNEMESTLMHKYQILTSLGHLTYLSLGYCTGYTARIWRECVKPATRHLKQLSLCGWNGNGCREAPMAWKYRQDLAQMTHTSVDFYMEDVEKALAEMLAGMHHLESLTLLEFKCTTGVIRGMEQLTEDTGKSFSCKSLQARVNGNDDASPVIRCGPADLVSATSLMDFLDWHLLKVKFKLSGGSRLVRTSPPPSS